MARFTKEFATMVLLAATYSTDAEACKKFGISERTLFNYRQRLAEDSELSDFFHTKNNEYIGSFVDDLLLAVRSGAKFIREVTQNPTHEQKVNPEYLHAVAGAVKVCAEVAITHNYIQKKLELLEKENAGDAEQNRTQGGIFGQDFASPENELPN